MKDHRIGLRNETIISFGAGKDIRITGEVGRGASCIVYDAVSSDNIGVQHLVRVKECYPSYLSVYRNEKNELIPSEYSHEKFETAKKDFTETYKQNTKMRSTLGLINSTTNPTEITTCNHTFYTKIELDEGIDYGKYEDPTLKSLFVHIKSLAELIQKYHQNGYLYLDIKPENIFILPETDEHIILFDFDSVIAMEELAKNKGIKLSFSKGFSPFEQTQGQIDKIGKHTDIFSIGALVFYKLFGRTATSQECKISSAYPFGEMKYANEKYRPKLYRALDDFFKKTLSIAITPRWRDMQQVIDHLDELIKLSDIDEVYLLDSFQYDSAYFVGRNEEMEEIAAILATNQLVFLSGIGGIGKTELAKQYANKYRSQYDTVTFSVFEKNIETLVCDEILIHNVERDENEADADYFNRKIRILKQIATPKDLIIIDNFDVDSDENLEILFRCPCKFIITTRMDFRDYNYKQVDVDRLRDLNDVLGLFYTYNNKDYQGEENEAVEKLVDYVDRHTMTVELIAKYLRNSEELPAQLYGKFLQRAGTANTGEVNVKQRKDFRLRSESVNDHLRILFDVSAFDSIEQEIIRSLSLLAGIRIGKSRFHELCAAEDGENRLELLIRNGWVEYSAASGKISLHQVIQDLVYKDLAPNAENCPSIVEGMGKYIDTEPANDTENSVKHKLFEIFMERLSGNNLPYAKLCLKYAKENRLDEAEKICLNCPEAKTFDLLPKIYRKKIEVISSHLDDNIFIEISEIIAASEESLTLISELLDKIIFYFQKNLEKTDYIVKEAVETGSETDFILSIHFCSRAQERVPALDYIYNKIVKIFDIATKKLPFTTFSAAEKENFYRKIQNFYCRDSGPYKNKYFSDLEKAYLYQELINQLRKNAVEKDTSEVIDIIQLTHMEMYDMTGSDLGKKYELEGQFDEAITYYKKDCEKAGATYKNGMQGIAGVYFKTGKVDMGIACLEEIILHSRKEDIDAYSIYADLIKKLIEQKNFEKAKKYAKELLDSMNSNVLPDNDFYSITYIISAHYFLYLSEQDTDKKNDLWQSCLKYYKMLGDNEIGSEIYDFIMEYFKKEEVSYETTLKIIDRITEAFHFNESEEDIREKIIHFLIEKYNEKENFKKFHVILLIKLASLANMDSNKYLKSAEKICDQAQEYYDIYDLDDNYIQSLIYKTKADLLMYDMEPKYDESIEMKKLCDFELMAKKQISEHNFSVKEQIEIWQDAALQYEYTNNYKMMSHCCLQALEILKPVLDKYKFRILNSNYQELMKRLIVIYILMQDFDSAYPIIRELYDQTIEYLIALNTLKHTEDNIWEDGMDMDDKTFYDLDDTQTELWDNVDENNPFNRIIFDPNDIIEKAQLISDISYNFTEINKYDDAIRTDFATIYFLLTPEINPELLKAGNDIRKDIIQLCTEINKLLDQEIDASTIDFLVGLKESILICEDVCSFDTNIFTPTITKISNKCQYPDIEFKRQ